MPPGGGSAQPPAGLAGAVSEHTLKIEAARAGVTVQEYLARIGQGLLYCYRCRDWHEAGAFPADGRRHTGRAGSCSRSIRAAALEELPGLGQLPPPAAVWVVKRLESFPGQAGDACWYWRGHSNAATREHPGPWSQALDDEVARFPAGAEARDALIAAFGGDAAVPPGCRLVRLA